jgi:hypothetical protein
MDEKNSWGLLNFVAIIILGAILIIGGSLLGNYVSQKQADKTVAGIKNQFQPVVQKTISYDGQEGHTALDLLKASHEVKTEDSATGSFVTAIDGIANTNDTYWMFYVNNELPSVASDQYQTKNSDKIEWRFEKLQ